MRTLACGVLAAVVAGCSPNSSVKVRGLSLEPASELYFRDATHIVVMVSDEPDICSAYLGEWCTNRLLGNPAGTALVLSLGGTAPGHYTVVDEFACCPLAVPSEKKAFWEMLKVTTDGATESLTGASGEVVLDQASASQASGSYSVTLDTGESLSGHFSAATCDGLEEVRDFHSTSFCTSSFSPTGSFDTVCGCGGRTASASCTHGGVDVCTCTPPTGSPYMCTGSDCCPLLAH